MLKDRNISYKHQSMYFPAAAFDKVDDGTSGQDAGGGDDNFEEVATTGFMAWQFAGGDDQVHMSMTTPTNVDWDNDVFYRVIWAAASAAGATETFAFSVSEVDFGTAPATAAPTAFASVSDTAASINVPVATPWASTNSSTTDGITGAKDMLRIFVDCTTDSANDPRFIGLEMKYTPKLTDGPQHATADAPTDA
mgnify:CR=1 FL=1